MNQPVNTFFDADRVFVRRGENALVANLLNDQRTELIREAVISSCPGFIAKKIDRYHAQLSD